ncbi:MAG TPA: diguanylate cyclase, partial [Mycobacteriales bacterium]|nr:diguanylate cyclase [Mycobacteriales bacterium]
MQAHDISDRKAAEGQLVYRALHDNLTDLPNRALFADRFDRAIARLSRQPGAVAVMFLDLDRFKLVNDTHGHAAGDVALTTVANRLQAIMRAGDTVARFGGDEFTILCEDLDDAAAAGHVAERVLAAVAEPFDILGHEITLSASVGIAVSTDADATADQLLRDADSAMYLAKERGRNRYEVFDHGMRMLTHARTELADALRKAVDEGELRVHYQPEIELAGNTMVGAEALVRWERPGVGMVAPLEFIGVAEETGLIIPLGNWVLREACREVASWPVLTDAAPLDISVNLSARQLSQPGLVAVVRDALRDSGLDPARLCLEITESVLMDDVESSIDALLDLKALGVRLAIDDFGTGYSSLSYLRRFP